MNRSQNGSRAEAVAVDMRTCGWAIKPVGGYGRSRLKKGLRSRTCRTRCQGKRAATRREGPEVLSWGDGASDRSPSGRGAQRPGPARRALCRQHLRAYTASRRVERSCGSRQSLSPVYSCNPH